MTSYALEDAERRRFSRRVVVLEQPRIVEELERRAREQGHSLGAEIRQACRFWLQALEDNRGVST